MLASVVLSLLLVVAALCQAQQSGPYRNAASGIKPASQQAPRYAPPVRPAAPGAVPPGEPPLSKGLSLPDLASDSGTTILDKDGRELLLKFDDYLFNNLEQAYYRLSYAFKDAVKRTMDKCHCDVGSLEVPAADTKPKPPA